jgi:hypothetical protein
LTLSEEPFIVPDQLTLTLLELEVSEIIGTLGIPGAPTTFSPIKI